MFDRRFSRTFPKSRVLLAIVGFAALAGCNPMAAWTNNQTGKAYYRAGRFAEAREEFRRATADSPRNPDFVHNYATASRRVGDAATAECLLAAVPRTDHTALITSPRATRKRAEPGADHDRRRERARWVCPAGRG